ncbi:HAD family hydrolase [Erysipelotrichaceae bacterium Oil+RF-744-GAM-WT-6]|uniref:HAD family hydrolase n=1 Tax=Stecheria intestinalis TaxID=2606630 RepID=A0A7X2TEW4_9FIRM|nr:HAD family hydrolase [Stecheria intestinalis]MSS57992.1 HAD family hydrolase [Stecheria intestinalis]
MKQVLFDLDGTLLPMDMDAFIRAYFGELAKFMAPYGFEREPLIDAMWTGTAAMVKNDGTCTNEQRFWSVFEQKTGHSRAAEEAHFLEFYSTVFENARAATRVNPIFRRVLKNLKEAGCQPILATNPLFPEIATDSRIRWAGLEPEDFQAITTYETSCTCKPNPEYFLEICRNLDLDPAECIMIGNDAEEDAAALETGMQVYLVTDCLINRKDRDLSMIPHGNSEALETFLKSLSF